MDSGITQYAIVQKGFAIYGIGGTAEEATEDAKEWLDHDSPLAGEEAYHDADDGALVLVRITDQLADAVRVGGGAILYDVARNFGSRDGLAILHSYHCANDEWQSVYGGDR